MIDEVTHGVNLELEVIEGWTDQVSKRKRPVSDKKKELTLAAGRLAVRIVGLVVVLPRSSLCLHLVHAMTNVS